MASSPPPLPPRPAGNHRRLYMARLRHNRAAHNRDRRERPIHSARSRRGLGASNAAVYLSLHRSLIEDGAQRDLSACYHDAY